MSKYSTLLYRGYSWLAKLPSLISWGKPQFNDHDRLAGLLASGYFVILTGSRSHFSGVLVSLLSWIKTGKWARYSHALMNCDFISDPTDTKSFKFVEATATGVHYSTFEEIAKCDHLCLLALTVPNATELVDALVKQVGKPYDDLFDLSDKTHISCVELVLNALGGAGYVFPHLVTMIKDVGNLIPQMYRDCPDFMVLYESK